MAVLRCNNDGVYNHTYTEVGTEVIWVQTNYSDGLCLQDNCDDEDCNGPHPYHCIECGCRITTEHYMCMDGGDSAHLDCVTLETEA